MGTVSGTIQHCKRHEILANGTSLMASSCIVAQTDNQLSAELTATSGRDSVAMKTLAFTTALFLPGTYPFHC